MFHQLLTLHGSDWSACWSNVCDVILQSGAAESRLDSAHGARGDGEGVFWDEEATHVLVL